MQSRFHSVRLVEDECKGCTICIKHCPTQAIRVYQGKARILDERCIDCGECMRVCPNHAKQAVSDSLEVLERYPFSVALLPPSFYGQFDPEAATPSQITQAVLDCGFDAVADVGFGADHVTLAIQQWLRENKLRPIISSACPAVVRLLQVRFSELLDHLLPLDAPVEVAARLVRERLEQMGVTQQAGLFFISPCPAKVTVMKQPIGASASAVDGAVAMGDVYSRVHEQLRTGAAADSTDAADFGKLLSASQAGLEWGRSSDRRYSAHGLHLNVEGIGHVNDILEELSLGNLQNIEFLELHACPSGCVGGCLAVQNAFIAKVNLQQMSRQGNVVPGISDSEFRKRYQAGEYHNPTIRSAQSVMQMDQDVTKALDMIQRQEEIHKRLPGLDCGACGSPTCQTLAEDIVRGWAAESDCMFLLRESVQHLAAELWDLSKRVPPTMLNRDPTEPRTSDAGQDHSTPEDDSACQTEQDKGDPK